MEKATGKPKCILSRAASLLPWNHNNNNNNRNHSTKTGGAVPAPPTGMSQGSSTKKYVPKQSHCEGKNLKFDRFECVHLQVFNFQVCPLSCGKRGPAYLSVYVPPNHAPRISKPWWLMMAIATPCLPIRNNSKKSQCGVLSSTYDPLGVSNIKNLQKDAENNQK